MLWKGAAVIWLLIGVIIGSVILDQLTKWLTVIYLKGTAGFAILLVKTPSLLP